jgi:MFS family permease
MAGADGGPVDPAPEPGPRSSFALVRDPVFGPYFAGKLLANIGIWVQNIAGVALVWELTRSAFLVGMVSVVQFMPQLLLAPLAGALADRGSPRRQLLLGRGFCLLGAAVLTGWVFAAPELSAVPAWSVMVTTLVVGIGFAVGGPAMQAMLPSLVGAGEVGRAVALDNLTFSVGRAVGPAVGGVVAAALGYGPAFAIAAVGHGVFLLALLRLPVGRRARTGAAGFSVGAALRYLRSDPVVAVLILGVTAVGIGADPAITLGPSLSAELGGGPAVVGLFASAFGVGSFLAFFLQAVLQTRVDHARLAAIGLALMAAAAAVLPFLPEIPVVAAGFAVGGAGMTFALTGFTTLLYGRVPREFIGRIMALWLVGFVGSRPLAAALNGVLTDLVSVDAALLATALLVACAGWLCRPAVLRRPLPGNG